MAQIKQKSMPNGFNFNQLPRSAKVFLVVLSILLVNLAVGLLIFGDNSELNTSLNTNSLLKGAEFLHMNP